MATYDLSYINGCNIAGLQMQGRALAGVNVIEFDWAELKAKAATWAAGDIITVGKLPKGALVQPCGVETLVASQAGASNIVIEDNTTADFVSLHDVATLGAITGATVGAATFFGGGVATGLHPVFLTAQKDVNVVLGAVPPTIGKCRISFPLALVAAIGL